MTSSYKPSYTTRDVEFWEQRLRALKKIPNPNDAVKHSIRSAEARIKEIPILRKQAIEKSTAKRLKQLEEYRQIIKEYPNQVKFLQSLIDRAPMSMNAGQYRGMLKKVESDYEEALYETEHTVPVQGVGDELPPIGARKVGTGDNEKEVVYFKRSYNPLPGEETDEVSIQELPQLSRLEQKVTESDKNGTQSEYKKYLNNSLSKIYSVGNEDEIETNKFAIPKEEFSLSEKRALKQVRGSVAKNQARLKQMRNEQIPELPDLGIDYDQNYMDIPGLKDQFKRTPTIPSIPGMDPFGSIREAPLTSIPRFPLDPMFDDPDKWSA